MQRLIVLIFVTLLSLENFCYSADVIEIPVSSKSTEVKYRTVKLASIHSQFTWPKSPIINVCWEKNTTNDVAKMWVKNAIFNSWESHSSVKFIGWNSCNEKDHGIHIDIEDVNPKVQFQGVLIDGKKNGMILNFEFQKWGQFCSSSNQQRKLCIQSIAVHEFGHALGFAHEHNRHDRDSSCLKKPSGSIGDKVVGPYDPHSVMNYCNTAYNNKGVLSDLDIKAVQWMYGINK
jgi:Astacin (Peptidase family M12A)